ncbi:MAG: DUF2807 domain-containing protein [Bacteroidales bacterium]|nr:DUF2807 domain-containing protein [Bacteroidales bacterium]
MVLGIPAEVIYSQLSQEAPFLQVSVDKNIFPSLDISVKNNRLIITQNNDSILKPTQFKIFTNSQNIRKINIEGAGELVMQREVNARDMEIVITGSGNIQADSLYCENLKVELAGSGNLTVKGAATNAHFTVKGSGNIQAFDYLVQHLNCTIAGSGNVEAYVHESLVALTKGSGNLKYKGNPEKTATEQKGSGNIVSVGAN